MGVISTRYPADQLMHRVSDRCVQQPPSPAGAAPTPGDDASAERGAVVSALLGTGSSEPEANEGRITDARRGQPNATARRPRARLRAVLDRDAAARLACMCGYPANGFSANFLGGRHLVILPASLRYRSPTGPLNAPENAVFRSYQVFGMKLLGRQPADGVIAGSGLQAMACVPCGTRARWRGRRLRPSRYGGRCGRRSARRCVSTCPSQGRRRRC